jgi:GMP synthase-like glutamine amidotransferase
LWIVDPSIRHPEDQGVEQILCDWPGRSRLFRPALSTDGGPAPGCGYDTDGVVIMGSGASVVDPLPWMEKLSAWLQPILDGHVVVPVLGICFGHQLIAHLAGAPVDFIDPERVKRIGVETSELDGGRLLAGRYSLRVVVSHCEEVKHAPRDYHVVARRGRIEVDGLEHRVLPVFSYQFHPEAREEFAVHAGFDPALVGPAVREDSQRLLGAFRQKVLGTR